MRHFRPPKVRHVRPPLTGREVFRVKIQCPSAGEASRWVTEISPQPKIEGEVTQGEGRNEKKLDGPFAQGFLQIWMEAA